MKRFSILRGLALAASVAVLCVTFAVVAGLYGCSGGPAAVGWFLIALLLYAPVELPAMAVAFIVGTVLPIPESRRAVVWWIALTLAAAVIVAIVTLAKLGIQPMECGS